MTARTEITPPLFLGVEAGGTRTTVCLADSRNQPIIEFTAGPANLRLLSDAQLVRHLRTIKAQLATPRSADSHVRLSPDALALGLAGARTEADWSRIRTAAAQVWPGLSCIATNDLETALMAAESNATTPLPRVLILSGTGSCCYGKTPTGKTAKFGGWGHLLGDKGSGYEIGLRALKATVFYYDRDGEWSLLGQSLLRHLQLNEPNDLIAWVQNANKTEIAALAIEVFTAAAQRDEIARDILDGAAASLAKDGANCAKKLVDKNQPVQFILAGSVLLKQPRFAQKVRAQLLKLWPTATVTPLQRPGVWGAIELARQEYQRLNLPTPGSARQAHSKAPKINSPRDLLPTSPLSPTEQRHPRSMHLDEMPVADAIELMLSEDAKLPRAIRAEAPKIEQVIRWITRSFKTDGRLFYVGAGTSGRLGVLDASECPPTFRTPPELVQGIIAGGQKAIWSAVEGAEDDLAAGTRAIQFRNINRHDVVIGIAASGRTPFVWGALMEAKQRGAKTVLLCFNPLLKPQRNYRPHLIIAPKIGPEILTGSTRLKSGTATKLILNMFTTLAMVRLGKVAGNLMIDLNPSNVKLRARAIRILQQLTSTDAATAESALLTANWDLKLARKRLTR